MILVGENATVVTLDADLLRMQGLSAPALAEVVRNVLARFQAELERGSMVTVKTNKITSSPH